MNNKGLTLVELLAVIVILGLLLIIAVPKIGDVVEDSRRNTFLGEAQGVYRAAKIKALDIADNGGGLISSDDNELDMKGNKLDYCIVVNDDGDITSITVSNGKYIVTGDSNFMSLGVSSVVEGNMDSITCEN